MSVLKGITVIEMCEVWQGPLAGQTLGDYGARVIKVERPPSGDLMRSNDFYASEKNWMSCYFAAANCNKESICLDLRAEAGKQTLVALLRSADILICNYRPGVMDRLGFGYEQVREINPRIIYAVATGYGETGPLAGMAGQDLLIQAISGMATKHAGAGGKPGFVNVPFTDFSSGMLLVQGILLALLERATSGVGQKVSISLLDTAIAMQSLEIASSVNYGYETQWFESGPNFIAQTADGHVIVLGFYRENPLQMMCSAFGLPDLSRDAGFATLAQQIARREELGDYLRPALSPLASAEVVERFQGAGILCTPVLTVEQSIASAQVVNNDLFRTIPVAGQPDMTVMTHPLRFSRTTQELRCGPPRLGEHTAQILDELGLGAGEGAGAAKVAART
jgi:crotonobetainyl-CoA:carnitine CoA-transferase CaiB-like acyl-CoA transferase